VGQLRYYDANATALAISFGGMECTLERPMRQQPYPAYQKARL